MAHLHRITPCLWFDNQAEEAAKFYISIFKNSRIVSMTRYPRGGQQAHHHAAGSVLTVQFEIEGQQLTALNAGPEITFNEAVSLMIHCQNQEEIDYYWEKLTAGGDPSAQVCGWLKDRYGVSWQVVPEVMLAMLQDPDSAAAGRVMNAMMKMKKLHIATLKQAHARLEATVS
jgi:predicted 3-demethylubiquinone-9 3-methyltransferase (glyoxalase superfamily)